jgi:hypothetical protein
LIVPLDLKIVSQLTVAFAPSSYVRVTPSAYAGTPLGMGFGKTRFASPTDSFKILYIAKDVITGVAETIIRDRFEGKANRQLIESEVATWGVTEISAEPLNLLDLRTTGLLRLGISTDIARAKNQDEARQFSQIVYDETDLQGILYRSRLTGEDCVAVYDRAVTGKLTAGPVVDLLTIAALVPGLSDLNIQLIKS